MANFKLLGGLFLTREAKIYKVNEILNLAYSLFVVDRILIRIPLNGDGTCDGKSTIDAWELIMVEVYESGVLGEIVNGWFGLDGVKNSTENELTLLVRSLSNLRNLRVLCLQRVLNLYPHR